MLDTPFPWNRLATIVELAEKTPAELGRTALMKYAYFLQVLRNVPLGYNFSLYAYGPFDAEVLDDLDYAQTLNAVQITPVYYPGGYGYQIRPGDGAEQIKARASRFLTDHQEDIDWVVREFGSLTAAGLELASTMIFVDREAARSSETMELKALTRRVLEVKPRFDFSQAYAQAEALRDKRLLQAVQSA